MKIKIERLNHPFHLKSTNEDGFSVETDASEEVGGQNAGMRPMQLLLSSLGTCSSIDVISILIKQKQELTGYEVEMTSSRRNEIPATFENIHLHFKFKGSLDEAKVKRAIQLSMEKYCSVTRHLESLANITTSYEIFD